jgi:hypothetical protein
MGSKAGAQAKMPGVPGRDFWVWLAGVIDARGGFTVNPVGIKIAGSMELTGTLYIHLGGRLYDTPDPFRSIWWQTRQADVRLILPLVQPRCYVRRLESAAMVELVEHLAQRKSYHGDKRWREKREKLRAAVVETRGR